jgi:hypothetical protein
VLDRLPSFFWISAPAAAFPPVARLPLTPLPHLQRNGGNSSSVKCRFAWILRFYVL